MPALAFKRPSAILALTLALVAGAGIYRLRMSANLQANTLLETGAKHLEAQRIPEAEQAWLQAKQIAPNLPQVYRALGELYRAQGRMPEAREAFNRLADLNPKEPHLLCRLAEEELQRSQKGLSESVARDAERAAELEPDCIRALTVAGRASMQKGGQKRAIDYFRRAVRLKPEDVPLTIHLINTMLESNDPAGAMETAKALTQRYPGYAQGYVLYAVACQTFPPNSPERQNAEPASRNALRLEPTNSLAHAQLGSLYNAQGDAKRAVEHLEAAWILYYERSSLLYQLSVAYRALGKTAEADRVFQSFNRISKLENELSALQKKRGMEPNRADLSQQIEQTNAQLSRARLAFEEGRREKFGLIPPKRPATQERETP